MKFILRQAALTLLSFAVLYALAGAISFLVFPDPSTAGPRDFQDAEHTIYMTVPKYIFLGRSVLSGPEKKVILVGASNTAAGLNQSTMQSRLSCAKVSNLGMGGANVSEVKQIIDLVHEVQDPADRQSNTFVIGIWFGMFIDSDLKYRDPDRHQGDTNVDIERYRYGFSRRTANGPVTVVPPHWLDAGVIAIRPLLLIEKLAREARATANLILTGRRSAQRTDEEREKVIMTQREKEAALRYWDESMGRTGAVSKAQFALLSDTINNLLKNGEKVTLIDIPIPPWHRNASPYQTEYKDAANSLVASFTGKANFATLKLDGPDDDQDYSDEVHAKPHLARTWSIRLADTLNSLICRTSATPPVISSRTSDQ